MAKFKGNALKKKTVPVYLSCMGEEIKIALNMAAIASIEENSGGSLQNALDKVQENDYKAIASFYAALITAGEGEECTATWVLNNFEIEDFFAMAKAIQENFSSDKIKKFQEIETDL